MRTRTCSPSGQDESRQGALYRDGRRRTTPRRRENGEEGISLGIDLGSVVDRQSLSYDPMMLGEDRRVLFGAKAAQERGRALDVGEQKRHRAGGQSHRHILVGRLTWGRSEIPGRNRGKSRSDSSQLPVVGRPGEGRSPGQGGQARRLTRARDPRQVASQGGRSRGIRVRPIGRGGIDRYRVDCWLLHSCAKSQEPKACVSLTRLSSRQPPSWTWLWSPVLPDA